MEGNDWINGYLEAIFDSGAAAIEEQKPATPRRRRYDAVKHVRSRDRTSVRGGATEPQIES
ncbi:hypothetical protein CCACVL1_30834 [Corchorus capsularis]|uniref:Uncharacterized protein n=1 Tax=Corchorus capsularis TaxID=210143 RepID=A0A1R3FV42_COCAP|nr:hypothetical protein CCACVL1_30834 [Corchorus capsularis]